MTEMACTCSSCDLAIIFIFDQLRAYWFWDHNSNYFYRNLVNNHENRFQESFLTYWTTKSKQTFTLWKFTLRIDSRILIHIALVIKCACFVITKCKFYWFHCDAQSMPGHLWSDNIKPCIYICAINAQSALISEAQISASGHMT